MRGTKLGQESCKSMVLKKAVLMSSVFAIVAGSLGLASGCATTNQEEATQEPAPQSESAIEQLNEDEWAAYLPKIITKEDGTRIQKTPYATMPSGYFFPKGWDLHNTYVLDADNRGCTGCHSLEDVLTKSSLQHWLYYGQYDNEKIRYDDCFGCHDAYGVSMQDFQTYMHSHMDREAFLNMGGTCNSCHFITDDGEYKIWDDVKYDVMHGITDVAASDIQVNVDWNQDEITPIDKMFVQKKAKMNWESDVVPQSDDIRDTYSLKIYGDMDNPIEMSIQEMIDKFGTEKRTIAYHCTINGTGGPYIYQAEVEGIPLNKVLETVGLHEDANMFDSIGVDGYDIPIWTEVALASDPLLVFEMNGEELTPAQGYPLGIWFGDGISAGQMTRYLSEIRIAHSDDPGAAYNNYNLGVFGDYVDPRTGNPINTPNIGVLTAESGQIFKAGQPVHLEGYAHAFEETVTKLEFSFDHGETWVEVPVVNTDNAKWVYWKMDVSNLTEPGSYLVKLRATSQAEDGTLHTNANLPRFLINIEA